jgi:hypothetical protein
MLPQNDFAKIFMVRKLKFSFQALVLTIWSNSMLQVHRKSYKQKGTYFLVLFQLTHHILFRGKMIYAEYKMEAS